MRRIYVLLFLITSLSAGYAQLHVTVELSSVWQGYNDVQAPNAPDSPSDRFSLSGDFSDQDRLVASRFEVSYLHRDKHTFELIAAPLSLENRAANRSVRFEGEDFSAGASAYYQFNTYRASYRYRLFDHERWVLDLGLTGLVRDAEIRLTGADGSISASNTDLGFVPLVSFYSEWWIGKQWSALIRGDALVGPQGRAEDVFAGVVYTFNDNAAMRAGYRIIEGGADIEQVYSFALFHFASIGLTGRF